DGEVESNPLLAQVSRGEIDGDLLLGQLIPAVAQRREHPRAGVVAGVVGEADQVEAGQPQSEVDLHLDEARTGAGDGRAVARRRPRPRLPRRRSGRASSEASTRAARRSASDPAILRSTTTTRKGAPAPDRRLRAPGPPPAVDSAGAAPAPSACGPGRYARGQA